MLQLNHAEDFRIFAAIHSETGFIGAERMASDEAV
jgi:hypothetical protein